MLALLLLPLVAGSLVYCVLTAVAAARYRAVHPPKPSSLPPLSVLKPLDGVDLGLEENLRTFFEQQYPAYELLFAVRNPDDPAIALVERLRADYPSIPSSMMVTGEPPYPNAKVYSLDRMQAAARHDLLVMADSDVRVTPHLLLTVAAEFANERVGLVTCPYRAVPGPGFWSRFEAIGLNTEFLAGVLVARLVEGMHFALGPTLAARRRTLQQIGGFAVLKDYLAEDFVMGQRAAALGWEVVLSSYVIEHHIGSQPFVANMKHRLRWNRSTRRSRPWGYAGQVFTNPLPLVLLLVAARPAWWPILFPAALLRAAAAWAAAEYILRDPLTRRRWWLVPFQDLAGFLLWLAAFFGNTILWRGRKFYLRRDGRFERVS
ncbi:MAG TPA: bacteriohopanetetrol glucosamine biosynthesis glycosyltransferase HpnI [Bryobacteraceae bacterium]|nr:bacteriohopanetetrol glucosamine biosynthesis glycosyltransferase HpnI [Bryobacteraceae bacterium]